VVRPSFTGLDRGEVEALGRGWERIAARNGLSGRRARLVFARTPGGWATRAPQLGRRTAEQLLSVVAGINAREIRSGEARPLTRAELEDREVRYIRRDPGEEWKLLRQVQADRGGDCEDLAAGLLGSMRATGRGAGARIAISAPVGGVAHVTVKLGNGRHLDPSRWGGMGSPREVAEAAAGASLGELVAELGGLW